MPSSSGVSGSSSSGGGRRLMLVKIQRECVIGWQQLSSKNKTSPPLPPTLVTTTAAAATSILLPLPLLASWLLSQKMEMLTLLARESSVDCSTAFKLPREWKWTLHFYLLMCCYSTSLLTIFSNLAQIDKFQALTDQQRLFHCIYMHSMILCTL